MGRTDLGAGERLVFEWRQGQLRPGDVTSEVVFEADKKGTRVTIEHRGWDTLPLNHPARHGCGGEVFTSAIGLRGQIDCLKAHAAHRPGRMGNMSHNER